MHCAHVLGDRHRGPLFRAPSLPHRPASPAREPPPFVLSACRVCKGPRAHELFDLYMRVERSSIWRAVADADQTE